MAVNNYQSLFLRYFILFGLFITILSSVISHNVRLLYLNNTLQNHEKLLSMEHNGSTHTNSLAEVSDELLLAALKESNLVITWLVAFLSLF